MLIPTFLKMLVLFRISSFEFPFCIFLYLSVISCDVVVLKCQRSWRSWTAVVISGASHGCSHHSAVPTRACVGDPGLSQLGQILSTYLSLSLCDGSLYDFVMLGSIG